MRTKPTLEFYLGDDFDIYSVHNEVGNTKQLNTAIPLGDFDTNNNASRSTRRLGVEVQD